MGSEPVREIWVPDLDAATREDYTVDLFDEDRVAVRMMTNDRNQIVDFAMIQQTREGEMWLDVCKVDCKHAEVHIHRYGASVGDEVSRVVLRNIESIDDVHQGWDEAADIIYDHWEDNLGRWKAS